VPFGEALAYLIYHNAGRTVLLQPAEQLLLANREIDPSQIPLQVAGEYVLQEVHHHSPFFAYASAIVQRSRRAASSTARLQWLIPRPPFLGIIATAPRHRRLVRDDVYPLRRTHHLGRWAITVSFGYADTLRPAERASAARSKTSRSLMRMRRPTIPVAPSSRSSLIALVTASLWATIMEASCWWV
jgi:hypothetical protein